LENPRAEHAQFASIEEAVAAIRAGQMVIVVDDEDRENEGDLTIALRNYAASHQFHGAVWPRTDLPGDDIRASRRARNSTNGPHNSSRLKPLFRVSIEAKEGTTTGISAADRAATVLAAINRRQNLRI